MDNNTNIPDNNFVDNSSTIGSKAWANRVLKRGIEQCKNDKRAWSGVLVEVLCYVSLLKDYGFWWQSKRLRNHLHLAMRRRNLQAESLTPREKGGDSF